MNAVLLECERTNPGDLSWAPLEALCSLTIYPKPSREEAETIRRIGDADIAITGETRITARVMDACPKLKYIAVLATGYNSVDVEAARQRNIPVSNVPTYGTASVAQHTMALLLEICNRVGHHDAAVHAGRWETCGDWCFWDYPLMELAGKTMGIIGFGKIGRTVGKLASAFGMRVLATGSRPTEEGRAIGEYVDLDTLLAQSDVVSLHCPLFPHTQGMINRESIAKMKDGVILLNASRGGLVVEQDLADALSSGKVAYAAVDAVSAEPMTRDNPLFTAPNCIITPHIAWAPKESRQRMIQITADNVRAYLQGAPIHLVN